MNKEVSRKIALYGSRNQIVQAEAALQTIPNLADMSEPEARLKILRLIEDNDLEADILFDGNAVWNRKKLLKNIRLIKKTNDMNRMSKYLYEFLHLCCGSIAHYNKYGWICEYPTVGDLKRFFQKNELGQRVSQHLPHWKTDAKEIVKAIEEILEIPSEWEIPQYACLG